MWTTGGPQDPKDVPIHSQAWPHIRRTRPNKLARREEAKEGKEKERPFLRARSFSSSSLFVCHVRVFLSFVFDRSCAGKKDKKDKKKKKEKDKKKKKKQKKSLGEDHRRENKRLLTGSHEPMLTWCHYVSFRF